MLQKRKGGGQMKLYPYEKGRGAEIVLGLLKGDTKSFQVNTGA